MIRPLVFLWLLLASLASGEERILSYHSRIQVLDDGMLDVTETIRVRAEQSQIQRGIFRDFPQLYKGRWGLKEKRPFEVTAVTRNGTEEPYAVEAHEAGTRVRIGDADIVIDSGEHTYTLRYRTGRQLSFFPEHDELYWNVTGNEWAFPIDAASAEVILPEGMDVTSIEGYIGRAGSKEEAAGAPPNRNIATISAGRPLAAGEGLTLVAMWPPRQLDAVAYEQATLGNLLEDNLHALAALTLLAGMLIWHLAAWLFVGRDPDPGLIIPQFAPPDGYSPAAVRMLMRMGFDNVCFSAAVLGLGAKGVLTIDGDKKKTILRKKPGASTEVLTDDEKVLFKALLSHRDELTLIQSNHKTVSAARSALQRSITAKLEKSHFLGNARYWLPGFVLSLAAIALLIASAPDQGGAWFMLLWLSIWSLGTGALVSAVISHIRGRRWIAAVPAALFSLPFVIGWFVGAGFLLHLTGPLTAGAFVLSITTNFLFYHWIKAPTHLGRRVLDHVEGFLRYLSVAEGDRLGAFPGPEKTPELFDAFLPYAHALGVEQQWAEKFEQVLQQASRADERRTAYRPAFYTGSHTGFDGAMAAAAIGTALTSALTTASTSPSSSSGGGGGGSSGGGGGGGGGGGW